MRLLHKLLFLQGWYYLATGVWPLVHIESFVWVSGWKYDWWLVKMVGALAAAISISLLVGLFKKEYTASLFTLSVTSAVVFLAVDVYYYFTGILSGVYLIDAAGELIFILIALLGWSASKRLHGNKHFNGQDRYQVRP